MTLGDLLRDAVERYPAHTALIHESRTWTYGEFEGAVRALGHHLRGLGIGKGDHVALMLPNCPEFVIAYFAIVNLGAVAVTLNAQSTAHELKHLLGDSDALAFITTAPAARRYEEIRDVVPTCRHLLVANGPDSPFGRILAGEAPALESPEIAPDDPAVMIYTSGLTGKPLGAMLTHRNLYTQSALLRDIYGGAANSRSLAIIPLFHSFGAVANMLAAMRTGAGIVLMERFTLDGIFQTIARERITYLAAVPRLFLGMLFHEGAEKYDVGSLEFCITGGSAMPPEFIPLFEDKFKVILREGYGLTEASPVCSVVRRGKMQKVGSIGTVIPGAEAKIFDEDDREVPRGVEGELVIRGENVMKGYYKAPEATAQVLRNGWLHTSDLAKMDEDDYIYITGRKKRMIITSGFNVYPREVEIAIELHPAVAKARIESKPDLIRGEIVKAFIQRRPDAALDDKEIMKHCRTYLSSYKVPREVEFVNALEEKDD